MYLRVKNDAHVRIANVIVFVGLLF
jgi:hypothetical protein